jgi:tetratricopeptide (TPR) repeat protein
VCLLVSAFTALSPYAMGAVPPDVLRAQNCRIKGDYEAAEQILRESLQGPVAGRDRLITLNTLADLLREQDRSKEARSLFDEVLNTADVDWDQQFAAEMGEADILRQEHNYPESAGILTKAADMARAHNDSLLTALAERGLGETWLDAGNLSRAEPLLRRALSTLESDSRVPRIRVAVALDTLASLYRLEDKTALAEDAWLRELEIHRSVFGEYHPQTAMTMSRLAELWSAEGEFDKAENYSRQSLSVMKHEFGDRSLPVGSSLVNSAMVETRAHHLEAAADMYSQALSIFRTTDADPYAIEVVSHMYAGVLSRMHKNREANQVIGQIQSFHAK